MADDDPTRARRYRANKGATTRTELKQCPSYPAHKRHKRRVAAGKPSDCTDPAGCQEAYNEHMRNMHAQRKAKRSDSGGNDG